ncbi:MAG: hypothetical protein A3J79_08195, partial [Elusimicrobia bacterium RIFOXYB2_FULL_62_6]
RPPLRLALTRAANLALRLAFDRRLTSYTPIFRLYRAESVKPLELRERGFSVDAELLAELALRGARIREIPVTMRVRTGGRSKMDFLAEAKNHLKLILRLKTAGFAPGARTEDAAGPAASPAWRVPLAAAALFLLSLSVSTWSIVRHFEGGLSHEFCHYGEIGRNIAEGKGYVTAAVYPATLAQMEQRSVEFEAHAPVLDRFPLYAYFTAAAVKLGGPNDTSVVLASAVTLALFACAAFALGLRFSGYWEGVLAGLLITLGPSFQRGFVLWGYPDLLFAALVVLEILLLARGAGSEQKGVLYWAAAGFLAGAGWLCRSNLVIWLPLFALALWFYNKERRALSLAAYAAAAALAALPAALYNLHWAGSLSQPALAYGVAHYVVQDVFPLLSYKTFSAWDIIRTYPWALAQKSASQLVRLAGDLPTMWQMHLVFPLAVVGAFSPKSSAARRGLLLMCAMFAVQALVFSVLRYEMLGAKVGGRYYLWAAPAFFLLAAAGIKRLAGFTSRPRLAGGALAAVLAGFYLWQLATPQGAPAHPAGLKAGQWPELAAAAEAAGPGGLIVTNIPAQAAWYGRRRAIGLPEDPAQLAAIARRYRVDAVLISRLGPGELTGTPAWLPVMRDQGALTALSRGLNLPKVTEFGTAVLFSR